MGLKFWRFLSTCTVAEKRPILRQNIDILLGKVLGLFFQISTWGVKIM
jgi:hypothetical protein